MTLTLLFNQEEAVAEYIPYPHFSDTEGGISQDKKGGIAR